ncbi:hypothetical protein RFI_25126, partial [Reticulomyxa filosa]
YYILLFHQHNYLINIISFSLFSLKIDIAFKDYPIYVHLYFFVCVLFLLLVLLCNDHVVELDICVDIVLQPNKFDRRFHVHHNVISLHCLQFDYKCSKLACPEKIGLLFSLLSFSSSLVSSSINNITLIFRKDFDDEFQMKTL